MGWSHQLVLVSGGLHFFQLATTIDAWRHGQLGEATLLVIPSTKIVICAIQNKRKWSKCPLDKTTSTDDVSVVTWKSNRDHYKRSWVFIKSTRFFKSKVSFTWTTMFFGCFSWITPHHYIKNGGFTNSIHSFFSEFQVSYTLHLSGQIAKYFTKPRFPWKFYQGL